MSVLRSLGNHSGLTLVLLFMLVSGRSYGETAGEDSGIEVYYVQDDDSPVTARAEIDRDTFLLNSVDNKYRVVRFRVTNRAEKPIDLSSRQDTFECHHGSSKSAGILRLQRADSALWGSLSQDTRKRLAYPLQIKPKTSIHVFVWFPKDKLKNLPFKFVWDIKSLGKSFPIEKPPAVAA